MKLSLIKILIILTIQSMITSLSCIDTCKGCKRNTCKGTAPFCGAGCNDCGSDYSRCAMNSNFSDCGQKCATGSKVCCCYDCDTDSGKKVKVDSLEAFKNASVFIQN